MGGNHKAGGGKIKAKIVKLLKRAGGLVGYDATLTRRAGIFFESANERWISQVQILLGPPKTIFYKKIYKEIKE